MREFDIKNLGGEVLFTAHIDCKDSETKSVKIGLAVKWGFKSGAYLGYANLRGANLRGANLRGAYLRGAYLRGANLRDANLVGANLRDANLRGANLVGVNLGGAYLGYANLRGANLRGANLRGANLVGVNLGGAYLGGANLRDADLRDANLLSIGNRSDGYTFYAQIKDDKIWIIAGCRYFDISDAASHWKATRGGTQLGNESLQLLKNARALVKIRGLLK